MDYLVVRARRVIRTTFIISSIIKVDKVNKVLIL